MTTTTSTDDLPRMPFARDDVLEMAPQLRALQESAPIAHVRTPAGDVAWLVTGYDEARALFADPRLGRSHPDPENAARISSSVIFGGPMGGSPETERANHTMMRKLLAPAFSARRMGRLREHVAGLVSDRLDALAAAGAPADLHEILSFPLPVLVICELLGVPFEDRDRFAGWSEDMSRLDDRTLAEQAAGRLQGYIRELIQRKRTDPGEDVLSDFAGMVGDGPQGEAALDGLAGLGSGLLFAGHETTVGRIDVGVLLLLDRDGEWAALAADPSRADTAVEEILRLAAPGNAGGIPRYAHEEITVGDVVIRTGDAVLLSPVAANRDPKAFPEPERFDAERGGSHLAFGHGPYFCVGASLARVELTEVFRALPARFPGLALAVDRSEIEVRGNVLTGGIRTLPVTW
ncbi:cytochrome P450 [Pseudonocardia endophytica]|uniref:cytochrome P450 n=1 Tax=Pseudonocardia endophytica TaxID=401976 RepID=UPI00311DD7F0